MSKKWVSDNGKIVDSKVVHCRYGCGAVQEVPTHYAEDCFGCDPCKETTLIEGFPGGMAAGFQFLDELKKK